MDKKYWLTLVSRNPLSCCQLINHSWWLGPASWEGECSLCKMSCKGTGVWSSSYKNLHNAQPWCFRKIFLKKQVCTQSNRTYCSNLSLCERVFTIINLNKLARQAVTSLKMSPIVYKKFPNTVINYSPRRGWTKNRLEVIKRIGMSGFKPSPAGFKSDSLWSYTFFKPVSNKLN